MRRYTHIEIQTRRVLVLQVDRERGEKRQRRKESAAKETGRRRNREDDMEKRS